MARSHAQHLQRVRRAFTVPANVCPAMPSSESWSLPDGHGDRRPHEQPRKAAVAGADGDDARRVEVGFELAPLSATSCTPL